MFYITLLSQLVAAFESLPAAVKALSVFTPKILLCIILDVLFFPYCAQVQNTAEQNLDRDHSGLCDQYLQ